MNIFTVLLLRTVAFVLVTYFSVNTELAVALTSDPEIVAALNVAVSALVVMIGETIGARFGKPAALLIVNVAKRFAARLSEKVVLRK